jgi:penicillin-binding protein 1A
LEIAPAKQVSIYSHRMGIKSRVPVYESLALGTAEVTPLELTSAYGVFGNEGVLVSPIAILRIEDNEGNVIEDNSPNKKEVLSKETAYLMTDLLKGVVNGGTGSRVRSFFSGVCAGKTGTTNDYADAWFIGFTPQLTAGTWIGFDEPRIRFKSSDGELMKILRSNCLLNIFRSLKVLSPIPFVQKQKRKPVSGARTK